MSAVKRSRVLRTCMQVLVLINLAFVQITGAAGTGWLLPLYALTLGMPLLERYRERIVYRLAWNGIVVAVFLMLLRHALGAHLVYVLEDGLLLAVLCQVHLLNNLRPNQRPDLLFFNAFLIAIITGFMSNGLGFPIAFLAFVPCYVIGLQLLSAARAARSDPSEDEARRFTRDGIRRSAVLLAASIAVFLFWPRDFQRRAFLRGAFEAPTDGGGALSVGFTEELRFGRSGTVAESSEVALRLVVVAGTPGDVPLLWRGATLSTAAEGGWEPPSHRAGGDASHPALDTDWRPHARGLVRDLGGDRGAGPRLRVTRSTRGTERLFAPLQADELVLSAEYAGTRLRSRTDGTIECAREGEITYELSLTVDGAHAGGSWDEQRLERFEPLLSLADVDATEEVELARMLADRVLADVADGADQNERVARLGAHLSRSFEYVRPGDAGGADSLVAFLRAEAGGHCELFAAALATMLRTQRIPCRVVTGFRATPPADGGETGDELLIHANDAHAWVEVLDPQAGWYAVDPTPRAETAERGLAWLARVKTAARAAWERVTGFDSERRGELFAWARARAAALWYAAVARPAPLVGLALALLAAAAALAHRRRLGVPPAIRAYRVALRRARVRLRPGETPRELLERARREGVIEERLTALAAETRRHERARYAG